MPLSAAGVLEKRTSPLAASNALTNAFRAQAAVAILLPERQRQDDCNARRAAGSSQQRLGRQKLARREQAANIFLRREQRALGPSHRDRLIRSTFSVDFGLGPIACFGRPAACFSNACFDWVSFASIRSRLQIGTKNKFAFFAPAHRYPAARIFVLMDSPSPPILPVISAMAPNGADAWITEFFRPRRDRAVGDKESLLLPARIWFVARTFRHPHDRGMTMKSFVK